MKNEKINLLKIGTDPEFFIRDTQKEEYVSSEGLVGGTKDKPLPIDAEGCFVQEDNVMVEFCIPPSNNPEELYNSIQDAILCTNRKLESINPNYMIVTRASAEFSIKQLDTEQAQTVGCDPDRNAWFDMDNPIPDLPQNLRFAGGHIHISYENPNEEDNIRIVKALDLFLGVPSVLMDIDDRRKELYGTPGRYRDKKYGVEYRTLSNYWTESIEKVRWVFQQVHAAINFLNENKEFDLKIPVCIDTNNKDLANIICEENNIQLLNIKLNEFISQ